jgi:hypothetical protein
MLLKFGVDKAAVMLLKFGVDTLSGKQYTREKKKAPAASNG